MSDQDAPTFNESIAKAAALLRNAELETDLVRMGRVNDLADSWINIATVLAEHLEDA